MFKLHHPAAALLGLAVGLLPTSGRAQDIEILMALPAPTLTFSSAFIAEDAGFYKKEGLKVTHRILVGVASPNAVIAGAADFTIGTGPVFLRAAAAGQRLFAIANLIDRPLVELVLRKDVAEAAGITDKTPFAERAKALKGKTVAIQGVGSIVHAWERLVVSRGGLDVEKDVRIAPMDPPAMLPALVTKSVDGFATSLPFTTEAVLKGHAIMLASGAERRAGPAAVCLWADLHAARHVHQAARQVRTGVARARRRQQIHPGEAGRGARNPEEALRQDGPGGAGRRLEDRVGGARQGPARDDSGSRPFAEGQHRGQAAQARGRAEGFDGLYTDEFVR